MILEPFGLLVATIPDDNMGDLMGEVNKRRGRVLGMEPDKDGLQIVEAEVPVAEMFDFSTFLRQATHGRGSYTFSFVRYEELPAHLVDKVVLEAKARGDV